MPAAKKVFVTDIFQPFIYGGQDVPLLPAGLFYVHLYGLILQIHFVLKSSENRLQAS
nr:hypothetical protein [Methanosarcina sp. Kolksee]